MKSFALISILFCCFYIPGTLSSGVTLGSIQIFTAHEFLSSSPVIYFSCQGEDKQVLPDVKEKHFHYVFNGKESWQPLTELEEDECKKCGLYEFDRLKSNYTYDDWELCYNNFVDGKFTRTKLNEFNATFICKDCGASQGVSIIKVISIFILVSAASIFGALGAYKYWRKWKRERDQARFMKLFENDSGLEDELGRLSI